MIIISQKKNPRLMVIYNMSEISNSNPFKDKVILLTGGTGSFGTRFVQTVLDRYEPSAIRIFSRNEIKQVELERKMAMHPKFDRLRFLIGDVREKERLNRAMNGVDVVVHAAALKHVPVCEYNPMEAMKTNVLGAENVINCAIDNNVVQVMAVSTDKAVAPVNLYGATKMVAEKLFIQANAYSGGRNTRFSCVRYGNVIGSSGSIVQLFLEQASKNGGGENGEITITDERMTRFWITLEQGIDLVRRGISLMRGGEIFIPRISSASVMDLASVLAPKAKRKIIGIRPGEKLHEVLITPEEARHTRESGDLFIIMPEFNFWQSNNHADMPMVKSEFNYSSDRNPQQLSQKDIRNLLVKEGWLK